MDKTVRKYSGLFRDALIKKGFADADEKAASYSKRLTEMYASQAFKEHDIYPTMNVRHIYAVIAMCLELRGYGMSDSEIMEFTDLAFEKRKKVFAALEKAVDALPNCYRIAEKWNLNDHEKRVRDGSITYDVFDVSDGKIEYSISKCMYVEMFRHYGIRSLCKIFCRTDEDAYARLTKHVKFIRHSDLSDGPACRDEVIRI